MTLGRLCFLHFFSESEALKMEPKALEKGEMSFGCMEEEEVKGFSCG